MSSVQPDVLSARSLFKRMVQDSGTYSVVQFLPPLVSMILVPITTRVLTRADYGIQDLLSQVMIVLTTLTGGYFGMSLGYFYFNAEPSVRHKVVGTSVIGSLILGTLACLIFFPFANVLSSLLFPHIVAAPYLRLMLLLLPLNFFFDAVMTWLRVVDRPGAYLLGSVIRYALTIICTVWFVGILKLHVWGVLYSTTIALLTSSIAIGLYWIFSAGISFDPALFGRIMRYAIPLGASGMAMFILHFGDSFILPHYRPFDDLGIYRLAYKIAFLVSAAYGAFGLYWYAQAFHIMRRDDADVIFPRLFTYAMLGVSFCSLGLIVCARPALLKMAGPAFQDAASLVPVLVIAYFLRSISDFMRILFLAAGLPSYDAATAWIGAVACLAGYAILIPKFGVWGAAYATVAGFAVLAAVALVWTYRVRPYRLEGVRLAKIGVASAVSTAAWLLIGGSSFGSLLAAAFVALTAFPASLWLLRFPTPGEWTTAQAAMQRAWRSLPIGRA